MNKKMRGSSSSIISSTLIIFAILGYFVYGTLNGVLAVVLLYFITGIINILSLIPIIGWIASSLINWFIIIPWIMSFTGIEMSWLIYLLFGYQVIIGLIITSVVIIAIIGKALK